MAKKIRTYSDSTLRAIRLLASLIKSARKRKGWSESDLAERCGATRPTIRKIEQGSPATEIGLYFEIANILGIPLFADDARELSAMQDRVDLELSVLPQRIRKDTKEVFDDF
jgi:transcriptional regulator with XRE-family HTH domain